MILAACGRRLFLDKPGQWALTWQWMWGRLMWRRGRPGLGALDLGVGDLPLFGPRLGTFAGPRATMRLDRRVGAGRPDCLWRAGGASMG